MGSGPGGVCGPTVLLGDADPTELCSVTRTQCLLASYDDTFVTSPSDGNLSSVSEATASLDFGTWSLPGVFSADATFFFLVFFT